MIWMVGHGYWNQNILVGLVHTGGLSSVGSKKLLVLLATGIQQNHVLVLSPGQHMSLYLQLSPLHPMAPPDCSLMGPDHGGQVGFMRPIPPVIPALSSTAVQPLRERLNSKLGEWYGC